jgi:hypothetical protein
MWKCPDCNKVVKQVMKEAYSTFDRAGEGVFIYYELKRGRLVAVDSTDTDYIEGLGATLKSWGDAVLKGNEDTAACSECEYDDEYIDLKKDRVKLKRK